MDFVKASQVDCFESLCDTPPTEETAAKKVKKSVDRTVRFLDESLLLLKDFDQVSLVTVFQLNFPLK